mmetsp:Transcript_28757/g.46169  ORF Transcript_28757/g.46169 Transcript_28757/m.46169 type:complete len:268 (-) Transcript_28757:541-1344(-)
MGEEASADDCDLLELLLEHSRFSALPSKSQSSIYKGEAQMKLKARTRNDSSCCGADGEEQDIPFKSSREEYDGSLSYAKQYAQSYQQELKKSKIRPGGLACQRENNSEQKLQQQEDEVQKLLFSELQFLNLHSHRVRQQSRLPASLHGSSGIEKGNNSIDSKVCSSRHNSKTTTTGLLPLPMETANYDKFPSQRSKEQTQLHVGSWSSKVITPNLDIFKFSTERIATLQKQFQKEQSKELGRKNIHSEEVSSCDLVGDPNALPPPVV